MWRHLRIAHAAQISDQIDVLENIVEPKNFEYRFRFCMKSGMGPSDGLLIHCEPKQKTSAVERKNVRTECDVENFYYFIMNVHSHDSDSICKANTTIKPFESEAPLLFPAVDEGYPMHRGSFRCAYGAVDLLGTSLCGVFLPMMDNEC